MKITIDDVIKQLDMPSNFFQNMHSLMVSTEEIEKKSVQVFISDAIKNQKIDIWKMADKQILDNSNIFTICACLRYLVSCLNDIDLLISIYKKFHESMSGDSMGGIQFDITKEICDLQPINIDYLQERLSEINEPFTVGHLSTILVFKSQTSFDDIFAQILKMGYTGTNNQINIALSSLSRLNTSDHFDDKLGEVHELFLVLKNREDTFIDEQLVWILGILIERSKLFQTMLMDYSTNENPEVKYRISHILMLHSDNAKEEWFQLCLLSLTRTSCEYGGIIQNIDMILYSLLDSDEYLEIVEKFFFDWILHSNIAEQNENIQDLLGSFIHKAMENKKFMSRYLTLSLSYENSKLHKILSRFLSVLAFREKEQIEFEFDKELLHHWSNTDYIFACRKILAWFYQFELQSSLIFALLKADGIDENVKNIVQEVFVDFIGKNFQHNTIAYLEEGIKNNLFSKAQQDVAAKILPILIQRQTTHSVLPRLKELEPSLVKSRLITREESKQMQKSMKEAKKKSIIRQLVTEIPIKYGKGNISFFNGSYSDVNYMQSFSTEVSISISEFINPIDASMQRALFKLAKKDEK